MGVTSFQMTTGNRLSDTELQELATQIDPWTVERNADNTYWFMPPVSSFYSSSNQSLARMLGNWAEKDGTGLCFDATGGFTLPDGSNRSPDAAWVRKDRITALAKADRYPYLKLAPDFIAELRSPGNTLTGGRETDVMHKMSLWMANGVRLGWLIDPMEEKAYIFRAGKPMESIASFESELSGEDVLKGFVLPLIKLRLPQ